MARADEQATPVMAAEFKTRIERSLRIPMRDGKFLSADLIRPDVEGKFPCIVEYHPYRKDDVSRSGHGAHVYFAERGFIGVRLDVRGTGGSDGTNTDEYLAQEQLDGYDAVEWLAAQPWCNGKVGMFGTSYGGFTCVQVAMNQPPHLAAIVPMYATDDRYTDDCHYTPGGNMRMYYDVGTYGGNMVAMNALPPVPEFAGADWAETWRARLEQNEPYILTWMKHQVDGDYWRGASLRPDYSRVKCPTFLIGGWRDGYANAMLRMYVHLPEPKKLLMGPWVHVRPNASVPGPRIDYLNEVCRFFAHWLRGQDTGMLREPPLTVYMQDATRPDRTLDVTPGGWRQDEGFPAKSTRESTWHLAADSRLAREAAANTREAWDDYEYRPTVGLANGYWSAGGMSFYLADDQRADEAHSLVYTTAPLEEDLRILGWPRVILHVASTARVATFVAKLAEVSPEGYSTLIVDGSINGTRRNSLTEPEAMVPGEVYELEVPMNPTGWTVRRGHRLRLAISSSDFPNLWPTPEPARNRVHRDATHPSRLILPLVAESQLATPKFAAPVSLAEVVKSYGEPPAQQVIEDQITGLVTVINRRAGKTVLEGNLGTLVSAQDFRCSANTKNPAQASIVGTHRFTLEREDGTIEVVAESTIRATATTFQIMIDLNVTRNGRPFFQKRWTVSEPRRLL